MTVEELKKALNGITNGSCPVLAMVAGPDNKPLHTFVELAAL